MTFHIDTLEDPAYNRIVELLKEHLSRLPLPQGTTVGIGRSDVFDGDEDLAEGWQMPVFINVQGFTSDPDYDAVGYCCAHAGTPEQQATWLLTQVADDLPLLQA